MKQQFRVPFTVMSLIGVAVFASCHKDNDVVVPPTPPATPLQAYIAADTSLSTFNAAIQRSGSTALYGGTDSVTVLAPTNAAFAAAGITPAAINSMSPAAVDSLLRYHFINSSAHLNNGSYQSFNSQLGPSIYGYGGVADSNYFNGAMASKQPAITGSNATVYKLNAPLGIPYSSTTSLLAADTSLSYFSAAATKAGVDLTTAGPNGRTVLAPTNAAFIAAGYPTIASINSADSATLRSIIEYHVLPNMYFTNSFNGLSNVATISEGNNIAVGNNNGTLQFTGTGNTTPVTISGANRIAGTNTIVQTVNGVLMR